MLPRAATRRRSPPPISDVLIEPPSPPPTAPSPPPIRAPSGGEIVRLPCIHSTPHLHPISRFPSPEIRPLVKSPRDGRGFGGTAFALYDDGDDGLWGDSNPYYCLSSSDDEESDFDLVVNPNADVELPSHREHLESPDPALTVTAHRLATIQGGRRRSRISGIVVNMGLIAFLAFFLLYVDWCSWRIVRLPLEPFYLTRPFSISALLSACAGCLYIPIADSMKVHRIIWKRIPVFRSSKRAIPTMGGLFFIPIGVTVARGVAGLHSIEVSGAAVATFALAAAGLLDDILTYRGKNNHRLLSWMKFSLLVAVGTLFSCWLDSACISTPYSMKFLIPLPPPAGLVYMGKFYLVLSTLSFLVMGNGVKLTDGLDGMAGGTAALAFIGMSVTVLAISPELAIFGASMAGACVGFLFHNSYRASVYMGEVGYLAVGGALAAVAACTGMFFPLFISSGVFVLEVLSLFVQVFVRKSTGRKYQSTRHMVRISPLFSNLLLYGLKEPLIVALGYAASGVLALSAGYVGLISA